MFTTHKTLSIGFSLFALATLAFAGCEDKAIVRQVCSEPQQIVREVPGGVEITGIPSQTEDGRLCELRPTGTPVGTTTAGSAAQGQGAKARP